jgi:hypothetical protein
VRDPDTLLMINNKVHTELARLRTRDRAVNIERDIAARLN